MDLEFRTNQVCVDRAIKSTSRGVQPEPAAKTVNLDAGTSIVQRRQSGVETGAIAAELAKTEAVPDPDSRFT